MKQPAISKANSEWLNRNISRFDSPYGNTIEVEGVEGFLIPGDMNFIYQMAATLPANGTYLEVGSYMGLSAITAAMSLNENAQEGGRIICVDHWKGSPEHAGMEVIRDGLLHGVFRANVDRLNMRGRISECSGDSVEVSRFFEDQSLDMIFIDGNHTYQGCMNDLQAWYPKLKENGRIFGHDATPEKSEFCGVRQALAEFCEVNGLKVNITPPPASHYMWEISSR